MSFGLVIAGVGAAASAYGAYSSNKNSKAALGQSQDATNAQQQMAQQQYDDWKNDFLPLQRRIVNDANSVDSPEAYARAAEGASADVTQAYGKAKTDLSSRLASFGVDPSSGKYSTSFTRLGLSEAANDAGAQTTARWGVADRGRAARLDAYSVGKGIPATAMTGLNAAAGNQIGLAGIYGKQASGAASGFGQAIQKFGTGLQDWWNRIPGGTNADPAASGTGSGFTFSGYPEG